VAKSDDLRNRTWSRCEKAWRISTNTRKRHHFGKRPVVALNRFHTDSDAEIQLIAERAENTARLPNRVILLKAVKARRTWRGK
jgi:hypothetical protein